jgi:hypothetical protein
MRLDDFIAESIADIVSGVRKVQKKHESAIDDGVVIPYFVDDKDHHRKDLIQDINFDIAVTVTDIEKKEGGGRVSVLNIVDAGAKKGMETESSQVNRIQFSIPFLFPFVEIHEQKGNTQTVAKSLKKPG